MTYIGNDVTNCLGDPQFSIDWLRTKMLRYPARYFQSVWVSLRMDVADGDDECFFRGIRYLLSQLRL
jgi:hypothetical protein